MKKIPQLLVFILVTFSCSTSQLVQQYTNPETPNFQANKVLVVAIASDAEIRRTFEKKAIEALDNKGVVAVKSIDFFEKSFTDNKKSIDQLDLIETQLLDAGFDAILVTKVIGQESKVSLVQSYRNFSKTYESFQDYYYNNQHIYVKEQTQNYMVYNTETSLFCICPGKERELIWSGNIDMTSTENIHKNINDYIKTLFKALGENHILF